MENTSPKKLIESIKYLSHDKREQIMNAYHFAKEKHRGQRRRSGSPYIFHPVRIAVNLAQNKYDGDAISAALLHDTIEDTATEYEDIKKYFGEDIANIVNGVTKISKIKIKDKARIFSDDELFLNQVENYRKILFSLTSDIRIMVIKLYDRLDNVQSIECIPSHKRKFYARETMEIFSPIAERLGMGEIKGQLEDLSFPFAYPSEYEKFIPVAKKAYKNPQKVIKEVIPHVKALLHKNKIKYSSVQIRQKHLYSLFLKLKRKGEMSLIFDIIALRIIVETVEDCYKLLGLIHTVFKPLPNRIHDYIAQPKTGGYQSLHTTVRDSEGNIFEIQIRTQEMHRMAEFGYASHWFYKESSRQKPANRNKKEWIVELEKIEAITDGKKFMSTVKEEMFSQKVFVFTPKGDIYDLPVGSTAIDLAYRVHTSLGDHCSGIKINNRMLPLSTILETGDTVFILTSKNAEPKEDWLRFAKTTGAKNKIKHFLREKNFEQLLLAGKKIIESEIARQNLSALDRARATEKIKNSSIPQLTIDSALVAVGEKILNKTKLLKIIYPEYNTSQKRVKLKSSKTDQGIPSLKNISHIYAGCCKPKKLDKIIGYLTREHIIKIHKIDCKRISLVDPKRLICI